MLAHVGFLLALFVVLAIVKQATVTTVFHVSHHVSGSPHIAVFFYSLFFFPGTVVHELAHYFTAILLRVKVGGMHLWPKHQNGTLTLGYVTVHKSDPLRSLLIASAPFFVGIAGTAIVVYFFFRVPVVWPVSLQTLYDAVYPLAFVPLNWLMLYALISVSNAMFPSKADQKEMLLLPFLLAILGVGYFLLRDAVTVPVNVLSVTDQFVMYLVYSLSVVVIFDVLFLLILLVLRFLFEQIF